MDAVLSRPKPRAFDTLGQLFGLGLGAPGSHRWLVHHRQPGRRLASASTCIKRGARRQIRPLKMTDCLGKTRSTEIYVSPAVDRWYYFAGVRMPPQIILNVLRWQVTMLSHLAAPAWNSAGRHDYRVAKAGSKRNRILSAAQLATCNSIMAHCAIRRSRPVHSILLNLDASRGEYGPSARNRHPLLINQATLWRDPPAAPRFALRTIVSNFAGSPRRSAFQSAMTDRFIDYRLNPG